MSVISRRARVLLLFLSFFLLPLHGFAAQRPAVGQPPAKPAQPGPSVQPEEPLNQQQYGVDGGRETTTTDGGDPTAASQHSLPAAEEISAKIETVRADTSLAEENRSAIIANYEATLQQINQTREEQDLLDKLSSAAATSEQRLTDLRNEQTPDATLIPNTPFSARTPVAQLRELKQETEAAYETLNQRLTTTQETIRSRKEESKLLPRRIADLQAKLAELQAANGDIPTDVQPELAASLRLARQAELRAVQTSLALSQQKQKTYEAEAPVLTMREERTAVQLESIKARLATLTTTLSAMRQDGIEREVRQLIPQVKSVPLLSYRQKRDFLALIENWPTRLSEAAREEAELVSAKGEQRELEEELARTTSLVETDIATSQGLSRGVGLLLQRGRSKLPDFAALQQEQARLATVIDEVQETLSEIDRLLDEVPRPMDGMPEDTRTTVSEMRDMLRRYSDDIERFLIDTLIPHTVAIESRIKAGRQLEKLIDEHLLWVRNQKPLTAEDFSKIGSGLSLIFRRESLLVPWQSLRRFASELPGVPFAWVLALLLMFATRHWFLRKVTAQAEETRKRVALKMRPTFDAMLATVMLSLPPAWAVGGPGLVMRQASSEYPIVNAWGEALTMLAALILPLEFLRQFIRPSGVAIAHFNWPSAATKPLRSAVLWTESLLLPLVFCWRLCASLADAEPDLSLLARLFFALLAIVASVVVWRLAHPRRGAMSVAIAENPGGWIDKLRWLWHPAIAALPLGLAVLTVLGYGYSATQLAFRLYRTVWLLILIGALFGLAMRWLTVSRRRLALRQMKERSPAKEAASGVEGVSVEVIDDKQLDITTINQQTRRLIIASMFFGVLLGLYWIWNPVLPAIGFLERFELWTLESTDGSADIISLANLVAALPMIVLTFILVRNAPGLLETTILQRLPLDNAARYAITTLSSYAIAAIGIVIAASTLGLRWDSIQWLVAGLGVGLGFGLQEIFANFISGIILLFEQPIRVGDIVTLDGTTGVVSRIRMRATTITNWDRQEFVVPNRDFITGRLVNWTLTDTTNRVVIEVGIAYGSDTRKACKILESLCHEHPDVLEDPAPIITFEGFGDSTLKIVLRFYLATLENRLATIHDMHTAINERFQEAAIEIAFPQRDLHIRTIPDSLISGPSTGDRNTGDRSSR